MGEATNSRGQSIVGVLDARYFEDGQPWTYKYAGDGSETITQTYLKTDKTVTGPGIDCTHFVQ